MTSIASTTFTCQSCSASFTRQADSPESPCPHCQSVTTSEQPPPSTLEFPCPYCAIPISGPDGAHPMTCKNCHTEIITPNGSTYARINPEALNRLLDPPQGQVMSQAKVRRKKFAKPEDEWEGEAIDPKTKNDQKSKITLCVIGVLLISLAIFALFKIVQRSQATKADPVKVALDNRSKKEEQAAEKALENILSIRNWEQLLPFVRNREHVEPLMEDYYQKVPIQDLTNFKITQSEVIDHRNLSFIRIDMEDQDGASHWFYLQKTSEGYLIDWELMTNYHVFQWVTFLNENTGTPTEIRVLAKRGFVSEDDIVNLGVSPGNALSLHLWLPESDKQLWTVVDKRTEFGRKLDAHIPWETTKQLFILAHLEKHDQSHVLMIDDLLSLDWTR